MSCGRRIATGIALAAAGTVCASSSFALVQQAPYPSDLTLWLPLEIGPPDLPFFAPNQVEGGKDGICIGSLPLDPGFVGPYALKARRFGSDPGRFVRVVSYPEIEVGTGDFSIVAWIWRGANSSGVEHIVDKRLTGSASFKGYSMFLVNGNLFCQVSDGIGTPINHGGVPVPSQRWTLVGLTVDRDGVSRVRAIEAPPNSLENSRIIHPEPGDLSNGTQLRIGQRSIFLPQNAEFHGAIDEVAMFSRALTDCEFRAIHQAGSEGMLRERVMMTISESYCTAGPWSDGGNTGGPALTCVVGDRDGAADNAVLRTTCLPPNTFGMYLTSLSTDNRTIAANTGPLCLGLGTLGRFHQHVVFTGPGGLGTLDTMGSSPQWSTLSIPTAISHYSAAVGSPTSYFQFWFRINGGGSGLSLPARVDWE